MTGQPRLATFRGFARRLGGFALSSIIMGLASIASVPFVVNFSGKEMWAAIAVGQAVGSIAGIFVLLGWIQNGPAEVANMATEFRGHYFATSVLIRCIGLPIVLGAVVLASVLLATESAVVTVMAALSICLPNLGASWFYVGESNPRALLVYESLWRAGGVLVGTICLVCGLPAEVFASACAVGALGGVAASCWNVLHRYPINGSPWPTVRDYIRALWHQRHGVSTAVLTASYQSFPLVLIQAVAPAGAPVFALADKLKAQAVTAYRPFAQVAQGWTPSAEGQRALYLRARKVSQIAVPLGVCAGVLFASLSPALGALLGAGQISLSWSLAAAFGAAFGCNVISLTIGVGSLVPLGQARVLTISSAWGLVSIAALSMPLTLKFGAEGLGWAVAIGQLAVALYQTCVASYLFSSRGRDKALQLATETWLSHPASDRLAGVPVPIRETEQP